MTTNGPEPAEKSKPPLTVAQFSAKIMRARNTDAPMCFMIDGADGPYVYKAMASGEDGLIVYLEKYGQ